MMNDRTNLKNYRAFMASEGSRNTPFKKFVRKLLIEDPEKRLSIDQVLKEPFMREATATQKEV